MGFQYRHMDGYFFVSTETKYPDITDSSQLIVLKAPGNLRSVANMLSSFFFFYIKQRFELKIKWRALVDLVAKCSVAEKMLL